MTIQWDESLRVDVPSIDDQHEEIFEYFNKLTDALQKGDGRDEVVNLLAYLESYASIHFSNEECLMEYFKYPGLEEQRQQHAQFKNNINMLAGLLADNDPMHDIAIKADAVLIRYFVLHVHKLDKALASHMKSHTL
jgi:hemerythrin